MTCKHFLFQRFGMLFFTTAILIIPEFLISLDADRGRLAELQSAPASVKKGRTRKQAIARREERIAQLSRKYSYRYAVFGLVCVGLLCYVWMLVQDRTLLLPYVTFFRP